MGEGLKRAKKAAEATRKPKPLKLPLSKPGSPMDGPYPGGLELLAKGVTGYAMEEKPGGRIFVPVIQALNEGNGDVGRFLDRLPANVVIPNVTSSRLAGMLKRRGWKPKTEYEDGEPCDVWSRTDA